MLVGRSFKYHRPRGIVGAGPEEPNALVNLGRARGWSRTSAPPPPSSSTAHRDQPEPLPSLDFDVGVLNNYAARFLPAGFYYKTFIHPRAFWKHVFEPVIRQSAGLGRAPKDRDADRYEQAYAFCDVLVVGGGIAGLEAALTVARSGARVIVLEQTAHWGGRAPVDGIEIDGQPAQAWSTPPCRRSRRWRMSPSACAARPRASTTTAMFWPTRRWPTTRRATGGPSTGSGASARAAC